MNEHEEFRLNTSLFHAIRIAYHGKTKVNCPHCEIEMELPILPLAPIVVCQCEGCKGYVVPFAGQLLGLPKSVVESGQDADIRWAIQQVIMKMLHEWVKSLLAHKVEPGEINLYVGGSASIVPESMDELEEFWRSDDESESV